MFITTATFNLHCLYHYHTCGKYQTIKNAVLILTWSSETPKINHCLFRETIWKDGQNNWECLLSQGNCTNSFPYVIMVFFFFTKFDWRSESELLKFLEAKIWCRHQIIIYWERCQVYVYYFQCCSYKSHNLYKSIHSHNVLYR